MNQPDDFGWFTPEDFQNVVKTLAQHGDAEPLVIVGGQSLVAWTINYGIEIAPVQAPYLTQDLDLYGRGQSARWLAKQLGADILEATLDDATPNVATLVMKSHDGTHKLWIDVLRQILGVKSGDITRFAVPIQIDNGPTIFLLHPLLCMHSRFANLLLLANKRNGNGISQARISVEVVRRYLQSLLAGGQVRDAGRAAKKIADICTSPEGVFVHAQYQIDAMRAIDPATFPHPLFLQRVWPAFQQLVLRKRATYWAAHHGLRDLSRSEKEKHFVAFEAAKLVASKKD